MYEFIALHPVISSVIAVWLFISAGVLIYGKYEIESTPAERSDDNDNFYRAIEKRKDGKK